MPLPDRRPAGGGLFVEPFRRTPGTEADVPVPDGAPGRRPAGAGGAAATGA